MLSAFISKLLLLRQFSLIEKELKILEKNFYLQPLTQLAILQKNLEEKFGKEGLSLIYETSKQSFFDLSKDMEKFSTDRQKFFENLFNLIKHFGFGDIEIVEVKVDELKGRVKVEDNPFAKEYAKLFGFQKKAVDYLLAGIIAGYFSKFFDKDVECEEKSCIAKGEANCNFLVRA